MLPLEPELTGDQIAELQKWAQSAHPGDLIARRVRGLLTNLTNVIEAKNDVVRENHDLKKTAAGLSLQVENLSERIATSFGA